MKDRAGHWETCTHYYGESSTFELRLGKSGNTLSGLYSERHRKEEKHIVFITCNNEYWILTETLWENFRIRLGYFKTQRGKTNIFNRLVEYFFTMTLFIVQDKGTVMGLYDIQAA